MIEVKSASGNAGEKLMGQLRTICAIGRRPVRTRWTAAC